ncbi:hypothetical protein H5410_035042 [Solanum commersonii]|uniref:Serine-threonine/tyrosine-protein kinase catalytic domain-containing protein n=1 Tax=Solanum commersonii TaxID=4109 RepID=A0A9J5Y1H4_SOLCO|nr:hypothetical protein H5410_035042 [Solanum commersonii]
MKSDVYYFGILLLELMAKRKFSSSRSLEHEAVLWVVLWFGYKETEQENVCVVRCLFTQASVAVCVYYFGILLLELMAKRKFSFAHVCCCVQTSIANAVKHGKKYLVHECFTEVDYPTAFAITLLVFLCTDFDPDKRPSMKDVIDTLNAMGMGGVKRKRDEYDAEQ